jgi:hypothetical protein
LRSENFRFTDHTVPGGEKEVGNWVAASFNDTALCTHRRVARLQFSLEFCMHDGAKSDNCRELAQHIVRLLRTEAAPETDLATSCAAHALLLSFHGSVLSDDFSPTGNRLMIEKVLGAGGLDATVLFARELDKRASVSGAFVFPTRCAGANCRHGPAMQGLEQIDAFTLVRGFLNGFAKGLRRRSESAGLNTICRGRDIQNTLAGPDVKAALRNILTNKRPQFWEERDLPWDGLPGGLMGKLKNGHALLAIVNAVRVRCKAQGIARVNLDDLSALVPEEWRFLESKIEIEEVPQPSIRKILIE